MSQETKKVLEMLASGQITADDAEKLLEKLGATGDGPPQSAAPAGRRGGGQLPARVGARSFVSHEQRGAGNSPGAGGSRIPPATNLPPHRTPNCVSCGWWWTNRIMIK